MPTARKSPEEVILDLEGPLIEAHKFRRAINAFLDLIDDVANEVAGAPDAVEWALTVESGSAHLHALAQSKIPRISARQIVTAIRSGLNAIETTGERPAYFSDRALQKVRDLASLADGKQLRHTGIQAENQLVVISKKTIVTVDSLLRGLITDLGSIEGQLRMISIQGRPHFAVYDRLTNSPVECTIEQGRMPEVQRLFGKRVAVSGKIRYRKSGEPISIEVEVLQGFPDKAHLPTAEDVYGIFAKNR